MGVIVIETPQNIKLNYSIEDIEAVKTLIQDLDNLSLRLKKNKKAKTPSVEMPKDKLTLKDFDDVLGMWADREETGEQISNQIREANRKVR
jgi:hypothetical protein